MHAHPFAARKGLAPLVLGLVVGLTACGGGGGGGEAANAGTGSSTTVAAANGGGAGTASAAGSGSPVGSTDSGAASGGTTTGGTTTSSSGSSAGGTAEVRYALGPVSLANTTTVDYQTLHGMELTPSGYRVVWYTVVLDASLQRVTTWFEQRYDDAGQRLGGETVIAPPGDMSSSQSQVATVDGGSLRFQLSNDMRPSLSLQQYNAAGVATDAPIALQPAAYGHARAGVALPNGNVAIAWQFVTSVGPGEISTAVLAPGPR